MVQTRAKCTRSVPAACLLLAVGACSTSTEVSKLDYPAYAPTAPAGRGNSLAEVRVVPLVDHHQHLNSAAAAAGEYPPFLPEVTVPAGISDLLAERRQAGRDVKALAPLFSTDAVALNIINEDLPTWIRGRQAVAEHISTLFARPYRIEPVAISFAGNHATVAGYYLRPDTGGRSAHVLLSLTRGSDRRWRIAAEAPVRPGPFKGDVVDADKLIGELDKAGIRKAVVLSRAYAFGSDFRSVPPADEYGAVRAENDWVAAQVARFPDRLKAFCSFNPLRPYAVAELERCASSGRFTGIKLHFGNSDVDLRKPEHALAVQRLFALANRHGLAIVAHLWTSPEFDQSGDIHARHFLDAVRHAPDITVQVAHLAGGGRASMKAMETFAQAFEAGDPRTRRLYFDVATASENETVENLANDVALMRRIGFDRFLFGSDLSTANWAPLAAWAGFHRIPLTQSEIRMIANNVAPYLTR